MSLGYNTPDNYGNRNQTFTCQTCKTDFKVPFSRANRGNVKFCSKKCYGVGGFSELRKNRAEVKCYICEKLFFKKPSHVSKTNFCSRDCRSNTKQFNQKLVVKIPCQVCQTEFSPRNSSQKFCSYKCSASVKKIPESFTTSNCKLCGEPTKRSHISEKRIFCGKKCYSKWKSANATNSYSRAKGGKRADLNNLYVRSGWEANWARYLNYLVEKQEIKSWKYEAETFPLNEDGSKFYTPDFKIVTNDETVLYHEVKGWMDEQSKFKLEKMSLIYPEIDLILIDKVEYQKVEKKIAKKLNWE